MSIQLVTRVLELPLRPAEKLSLLVLADMANERGICWPSLSYVSARASVSVRSLERIIESLEGQGLLRQQQRFQDGRPARTAFLVLPEKEGGSALSPVGEKEVGEASGGTGGSDLGGASALSSSEKSNHHHNGVRWIFPKSLSEAERCAAARLLEDISRDEGQLVLDELAGRIAAGGIRSSRLAYLRTLVARARAGQFIPELAHQVAEQRAIPAAAPEAKRESRPASRETVERCLQELRRIVGRGAPHG